MKPARAERLTRRQYKQELKHRENVQAMAERLAHEGVLLCRNGMSENATRVALGLRPLTRWSRVSRLLRLSTRWVLSWFRPGGRESRVWYYVHKV